MKIVTNILAVHAVSGCDIAGGYVGIGKPKVVEWNITWFYWRSELITNLLHKRRSSSSCVTGKRNRKLFLKLKEHMEKSRAIKTHHSSKVRISSTNRWGLSQNLKRAHIQAAIWRTLFQTYPPVINPLDFGWVKELTSPWLVPSTVLLGVKLTVDEVLEIIRCSCSSQQTYKSQRCTCIKSCLSCSTFCEYQGGITCCDPSTLKFDYHFDESKSDKQQ